MTDQQVEAIQGGREYWIEHMVHVCAQLDHYVKTGAHDSERWRRLVASSQVERDAYTAYVKRWQ